MGIFSRLSDIVNSNVNSILDRAEDPEKIIRLVIQEMEETLVEVRATAARTIAEKKEVERNLARHHEAQAEWTRKAEVALRKGREDLSRAALVERAKLGEAIVALEEELTALDDALTHGQEDIDKLQAKLREAKAKQQTIQARHDTASSRIRVRRRLNDGRIDDAFTRFEQVERRIDRLEGEIEAYDMTRTRSIHEEFADLEAEADVDDDLAALKAKIAGEKNGPAAGKE